MALESRLEHAKNLGKKLFLIGAVTLGSFLINNCSKKPTGSDPEPKGNVPTTPAIYSITPTIDKPNRGMFIDIYDKSNNEEAFDIERKISGGSFSPLVSLPANSDSYTDWSVAKSTRYFYRIRARNDIGSSEWSSEQSAISAGPVSEAILTYTDGDTYAEETNPSSNFGDLNYFTVAGKSGYWGGRSNGLVSFGLPSIPPYGEFKEAYLRLCEAGGGNTIYPGKIEVYAVPNLGQWYENSVTWNNRPGTWLTSNGHATHYPNSNPCVTIDVTNPVSDWYSGVRANRGFALFTGDSAYCSYYSKEGYQSGSALLEVDYEW